MLQLQMQWQIYREQFDVLDEIDKLKEHSDVLPHTVRSKSEIENLEHELEAAWFKTQLVSASWKPAEMI